MKKRTFILMFFATLIVVAGLFAITSIEFKHSFRSASPADGQQNQVKVPREYVMWESMGHTILSIN